MAEERSDSRWKSDVSPVLQNQDSPFAASKYGNNESIGIMGSCRAEIMSVGVFSCVKRGPIETEL